MKSNKFKRERERTLQKPKNKQSLNLGGIKILWNLEMTRILFPIICNGVYFGMISTFIPGNQTLSSSTMKSEEKGVKKRKTCVIDMPLKKVQCKFLVQQQLHQFEISSQNLEVMLSNTRPHFFPLFHRNQYLCFSPILLLSHVLILILLANQQLQLFIIRY